MTFVFKRLSAVWKALKSLCLQTALWVDQGANAVVLGIKALFVAAWTGEVQAVCYADETLSAHAWRASEARKPWAKVCRPFVDALFAWQKPRNEVNAAAKKVVESHCERAFWAKKLRLYLPPEYRQ